MMLIAIVWAALAPLSLVAALVLLARVLRPSLGHRAWGVATAVVIAPVASLWWLDHAEFREVCRSAGAPIIVRRAVAEGVYLNSPTANSFGMRYVQDEGFAWVEAASIYRRGAWVRYERRGPGSGASPGELATTDIPALTARYEVRETFRKPYRHTGLSETLVLDRQTNDTLARAGHVTFDGGRAKWVLGAWGTTNCPSARTAPDAFATYYHLAQRTLR